MKIKLIVLTLVKKNPESNELWVNPESISRIRRGKGYTCVYFVGDGGRYTKVEQSPSVIDTMAQQGNG